MTDFSQKHLLGIDQLSTSDIETILDLAGDYAARLEDTSFKTDTLNGKRVLSLFFEDSTRTRTSFEMAAKNGGADWVNIDIEHSAVKKGETLLDTVTTLQAITRPAAIIMRHSEYGAPSLIAGHVDCPVINAGDGTREHPTQALLDALTILQHKETLRDLNIAICGDVAHSRVANSNMILLTKMGANVRIIAPENLMPEKFPVDGIAKFKTMEGGLKDCDIIMMLRLQKERMAEGTITSENAYFSEFGLTAEKLALAKPGALVMHPGPVNRNVEIADDITDNPARSLILKQVANGVPTRMAVLDLLLGNK